MIPDLQFSILCDDIRQEKNGKFIFIGLFTNIGTSKLPKKHASLFIANSWCNGQGDFTQRNRIVAADNSVLLDEKPVSFTLKDVETRHMVVSRFMNIELKIEGKYWVEVFLNDTMKLRFYFQVIKTQSKEK